MKAFLTLFAFLSVNIALAYYDDDITVVEACELELLKKGLNSQEIDSLIEVGGEPTEIRPGVWHLDLDVLHCVV